MKKIYYLRSCDSCAEILKEMNASSKGFELHDIKSVAITAEQLEEMKELAGSYESLFSRRAMKYKELNLKNQKLAEADYKRLILQEYTFLKRPVVIVDGKIFIGSERKTVDALKAL